MQVDAELKQELESEQKIWTFPTASFREHDEADTLISFYITLTDQPIRLKVRAGKALKNWLLNSSVTATTTQPRLTRTTRTV